MRSAIIAFAVGIGVLQLQAELPSITIMVWLGIVGVLVGAVLWRYRRRVPFARLGWVLIFLTLGFLYAAERAHLRLHDRLFESPVGQDIEIQGIIASMPQTIERGVKFDFEVETPRNDVPRRISLAWYRNWTTESEGDAPNIAVHAGERWQFTVRLKQPHGNSNPHGFDYEGWLFERGIRATGYVRPRLARRLSVDAGYHLEQVRELLRSHMLDVLPPALPYRGVLIALAIGDQNSIEPWLWQRFSQTGVTHLMSISGLHVTMLAALAYGLFAGLWCRASRLMAYAPSQTAATVAGVVTAWLYCLLSGFSVPAQRTVIMLSVAGLAKLTGRDVAASRVLLLALLGVLVVDPWAVLAAGFWLSFGAVALLFLVGLGRQGKIHWLQAWLHAQWAVTIGLLPALLLLFQQFSIVSPIANAAAVPLVSFIVTPLCLLGLVPGLDALLLIAHGVTSGLMDFLNFLAHLPWSVWQQAAPPAWGLGLALIGCIWLLLPQGIPARWLGGLAFLPILTFAPVRPESGEASITVLDVGQGLAVHVQTAGHDLLFDAGPAFSDEADSGNRIILPYLRALGVRKLDTLILSHADRDHTGGAESVLAAIPVKLVMASLPFEHAVSAQPIRYSECTAGTSWEWDHVYFEMLHPSSSFSARKTNDESCVLRIRTGQHVMLLTSDIESPSEATLVKKYGATLRSNVITAPHHGSNTSSSVEFMSSALPGDVIFPVGFLNRYGHPTDLVLERYKHIGSKIHRTDWAGAVNVRLSAQKIEIFHVRDQVERYWQHKAK